MLNNEVLAAIAAVRKSGSFKFKIVFTIESEISQVRAFVTMLNGDSVSIDDDILMKLRLVAILRKWQEDTDRIVTVTMCDNFDENEFVAKLAYAIEGIEVVPRACLTKEPKKHEGLVSPKKAIRNALANGQCKIKIVIPKATDTDVLLFMGLVKHGHISFADYREQLVFEDAARRHAWSLGGKLLANILR
jgi:hypothetical protein